MVDAIRTRIETTMMHAREIEENLLCLQMSIRQTQRLQRTSLPGNLELVHEYPTCRKEKKRKGNYKSIKRTGKSDKHG